MPFLRSIRPLKLVLLTILFSIGGQIAQAEVVCQSTVQVTDNNPTFTALDLHGNHLVWSTDTAIYHYDIATTQIMTLVNVSTSYLTINGDHLIWLDANRQIQLYTFSTGITIPVSGSVGVQKTPILDSGYILYSQPRNPNRPQGRQKLMLYDIAAATTTRISRQISGGWDMDDGRIVFADSQKVFLYDIATATTTRIGKRKLGVSTPQIDGQYVVYLGRVHKNDGYFMWNSQEVFLYDLNTSTRTAVTNAGYRTRIHHAWITGHTVVWAQISGLADYSDVMLYDIPSGQSGHSGFTTDPEHPPHALETNGRSLAYVTGLYDMEYVSLSSVVLYDVVSRSQSTLQVNGFNEGRSPHIDADGERIAWLGVVSVYNEDDDAYIPVETELFLRTNCAYTPNIISQSESGKVFSGVELPLSVNAKGDLPLNYQWYQGAAGDTSTPVGENNAIFITPPLNTVTSYWVRVSNLNGFDDSETITLDPAPSYQLVINDGFETPLEDDPYSWDDFWIDEDLPNTKRVCNSVTETVAFEGSCAYRFGPPVPDSYAEGFNQLYQELIPPILHPGDRLTVQAQVNSVGANKRPYLWLSVDTLTETGWSNSLLKLRAPRNTNGYTTITGTLPIVGTSVYFLEVGISYKGTKGHVDFDAVTVTATPGAAEAGLLPLPGLPDALRRVD